MNISISGTASHRAMYSRIDPAKQNVPLPPEAIPPGCMQLRVIDDRRLTKCQRQALQEGNRLRQLFAAGPQPASCPLCNQPLDSADQPAGETNATEESQP